MEQPQLAALVVHLLVQRRNAVVSAVGCASWWCFWVIYLRYKSYELGTIVFSLRLQLVSWIELVNWKDSSFKYKVDKF